MIELVWRNALYYLILFFRRPFITILPALFIFVIGSGFVMTAQRPFYSEGLLIMDFQQIPTSLVSPTVANDRLRFIEQRVLSRDNLVALTERFELYNDLAPSLTDVKIAQLMRNDIWMQTTFSESGDELTSAAIRLGFKHTIPSKAFDVTTELLRMVVDTSHSIRATKATETAQFLEREVEKLTDHLKARESTWANFIEGNNQAQPDRLPTMLIELQAKQNELSVAEQVVAATREEMRILEVQVDNGVDAIGPAAQLDTQIQAINAEIAEAKLLYSDEHPQMKLLRDRAADLRAAYEEATNGSADEASLATLPLPPDVALLVDRLNQARPRYEAALTHASNLKDAIETLKNTIEKTTRFADELSVIETERQELRRELDEMKGRLSTASMAERMELDKASFRVDLVEAPVFPTSPTGPRRLLLLAGAMIVSIGAGLSVLVLSDLADRRVRGAFDVAHALEGKTLVMIPAWSPGKLVKNST